MTVHERAELKSGDLIVTVLSYQSDRAMIRKKNYYNSAIQRCYPYLNTTIITVNLLMFMGINVYD